MGTMLAVLLGAPLVAALLLVVVLLIVVLDVRTKLRRVEAIPTFPEQDWLWGHFPWWTREDLWRQMKMKRDRLGSIFRIRLANVVLVVVSDPVEYARAAHRGEDFMDKSKLAYEPFDRCSFGPPSENILSLTTNDRWKALRKAISPCFSTSHMKPAFDVTVKLANVLLDQVAAGGSRKSFDISNIARRLTVGVISEWGFHIATSALDMSVESEEVLLQDKMREAVHSLWMNPMWWLSLLLDKTMWNHRDNTRKHNEFMDTYTKSLQERYDELPVDSLAGALLRVLDPKTGKPLAFADLKSNVSIIHSAGFETTASAFTSMMVLLLQHAHVMKRVEAELDGADLLKTAKRCNPRPLEWSDIGKLPYMSAVIKEVLRFAPPASLGTFRLTSKPTKICGYDVPPNTWVAFPHVIVERDAATYGSDAEDFVPERWLETDGGAQSGADAAGLPGRIKEPHAFSMGPRDCVGQQLARVELMVLLAMLIARFIPSLDTSINTFESLDKDLSYHITLSYSSGVFLHLERR